MTKVLLGVTGSVAACLSPTLITQIHAAGHQLRVIATEASCCFWDPQAITIPVYRDADEWPTERLYQSGEAVVHIELRRWADVLLIAPLSANTLAKMAHGLADNLLTSVIRAWDIHQPLIIAPAMNTLMWKHPATQQHLEQLTRWHTALTIIPPIAKQLACGDYGPGALADIGDIIKQLNDCAHMHTSE